MKTTKASGSKKNDNTLDLHSVWLARGMGPKKTLMFLVCIHVEPNPETPGEYLSTMRPLEEGSIIGAGNSIPAAVADAIQLFQDTVDDCIDADNLHEFVGDSGIMTEVATSIRKLSAAMSQAEKAKSAAKAKPRAVASSEAPAWLQGRTAEANADDVRHKVGDGLHVRGHQCPMSPRRAECAESAASSSFAKAELST